MILPNFRSILRYNFSFAYALSVGHLADRLRGDSGFATPWPVDEKTLVKQHQREELQKRLNQKGYDVGKIDGIFGAKTTAAIRAYPEIQRLKRRWLCHFGFAKDADKRWVINYILVTMMR